MTALVKRFSRAEALMATEQARAHADALWQELLELYEGGAHTALGYASWGAYFSAEFGQTGARGYQLLDAGRVRDVLAESTMVEPPNERQARELAPLLSQPMTMGEVWRDAVERYEGHPTAANIRTVVEERLEPPAAPELATHQLLTSSASVEWFTPERYIDVVRELLGAIDLDPASCAQANETVGAARYFTEAEDGLSQFWAGRVFLNPPYSRRDGESNQSRWSARLIADFRRGAVSEAVLLVNAVPAERWWRPLWDFPVCFPDHRIRFCSPEGEPASPTHSNAFVYLGPQRERFIALFSTLGVVVGRLS